MQIDSRFIDQEMTTDEELEALNTKFEGMFKRWKYVSTVATITGSTTHTPATDLTSESLPSGVYRFIVIGQAQSASTNTGLGLRISSGTSTMTTVSAKWMISQAANGTASNFQYDQLSPTTNITSASSLAANTNFAIMGEGMFRLTSAGTVNVQLRTEINNSSVTLQSDTVLIIESI
jgi:hypothetical protein